MESKTAKISISCTPNELALIKQQYKSYNISNVISFSAYCVLVLTGKSISFINAPDKANTTIAGSNEPNESNQPETVQDALDTGALAQEIAKRW